MGQLDSDAAILRMVKVQQGRGGLVADRVAHGGPHGDIVKRRVPYGLQGDVKQLTTLIEDNESQGGLQGDVRHPRFTVDNVKLPVV